MRSSVVQRGISIEIVEMVSFELREELRKMFFRLVTSMGQRKNSIFLLFQQVTLVFREF